MVRNWPPSDPTTALQEKGQVQQDGEDRDELPVAGLECSAVVGFAEDEEFHRNVLGRHSFLEQITFGLVHYEGQLYLSYYGNM